MKTIISKGTFDEVLDNLFNGSLSDIVGTDFSVSQPSINVIEKDDAFEIQLAAPGLKKEDFQVNMEKGRLSISSEQSSDTSGEGETESGMTYKRREFNYSSFNRNIRLPENVDPTKIQAQYEQGVLKIEISKKEKTKVDGPTRINID